MTKTPIAVLENDLGKNSCSLAGLDASAAVEVGDAGDGVTVIARLQPVAVEHIDDGEG